MLLRILLILCTVLLVIATLCTTLSWTGCPLSIIIGVTLLWGSLGAFTTLYFSQFVVISELRARPISLSHANALEIYLYEITQDLSLRAEINAVPTVAIYQSPELNAFTLGSSRKNSMIFVSSGALHNMNEVKLQAMIAHEMAHIQNGDTITLLLIQGIVNAFTVFIASVISGSVIQLFEIFTKRVWVSRLKIWMYRVCLGLCMLFFTLFANLLVAAFSRWREYRADKQSALWVGQACMLDTLEQLHHAFELQDENIPTFNMYKMIRRDNLLGLFATHPAIAKRIERVAALHKES